jgi:SulP family sulfate permease
MTAIDATGLHELEKLADRLSATGRTLLLCGARSQPEQFLRQSLFLRYLGEENMLPHVEAALSRAREVYEGRSGDPVSKVIYQT